MLRITTGCGFVCDDKIPLHRTAKQYLDNSDETMALSNEHEKCQSAGLKC